MRWRHDKLFSTGGGKTLLLVAIAIFGLLLVWRWGGTGTNSKDNQEKDETKPFLQAPPIIPKTINVQDINLSQQMMAGRKKESFDPIQDNFSRKQPIRQGKVTDIRNIDLFNPPLPDQFKQREAEVAITEHFATISGNQLFYREALGKGGISDKQVLLFHGQAFTSETWKSLGTLSLLGAIGYRAIAIDLPGYGNSDKWAVADPLSFMAEVMRTLGLKYPVIISPSMSGQISLPFFVKSHAQVSGFIAVAPVESGLYSTRYRGIMTPTLMVYGERDTQIAPDAVEHFSILPNHQVVEIKDADHAAYMDQPEVWHTILYNFLQHI